MGSKLRIVGFQGSFGMESLRLQDFSDLGAVGCV